MFDIVVAACGSVVGIALGGAVFLASQGLKTDNRNAEIGREIDAFRREGRFPPTLAWTKEPSSPSEY